MPGVPFKPGNKFAKGGPRPHSGRKGREVELVIGEIENYLVKSGQDAPEHVAMWAFKQIIRIAGEEADFDDEDLVAELVASLASERAKNDQQPEDPLKINVIYPGLSPREKELRDRIEKLRFRLAVRAHKREYRLKEKSVRLEALTALMRRVLGKERVSQTVTVLGDVRVRHRLEQILSGDTAQRVSRMGSLDTPALPSRDGDEGLDPGLPPPAGDPS